MQWVTNAHETESKKWRNLGYMIGTPRATDKYSSDELAKMEMVGVYKYPNMVFCGSSISLSQK